MYVFVRRVCMFVHDIVCICSCASVGVGGVYSFVEVKNGVKEQRF